MKVRRLHLDGFKALSDLVVSVPRDLMFMIGMNGAGKSSVLQAISFIRAFADGNVMSFFDDRQWEIGDVRQRVNLKTLQVAGRAMRTLNNNPIAIRLLLEADDGARLVWEFAWGFTQQSTLREHIWLIEHDATEPRSLLSYKRPTRAPDMSAESIRLEDLRLPGSILSFVTGGRSAPDSTDKAYIEAVATWARGITSLELLSPIAMRRGVRGRPQDIGPRGERLAGFIASLSPTQKEALVRSVAQFYPIAELETVRKNAGWVDMRIGEQYPGSWRHKPSQMSDGFMRILALCAIPLFEGAVSTVLLDEVEDGIEPHILPKIIKYVSESSSAQFIMTSHSPLLINHFEPDEISFLTRRPDGTTALARTSDMEMFIEGAEFFGVGEIWANTSSEAVKSAMSKVVQADGEPDGELEQTESQRIMQFAGAA